MSTTLNTAWETLPEIQPLATILEPLPEQAMYGPYFEAVQHPENWKMPIDAEIPAHSMAMTRRAIAFYTGSEARFEATQRKGWVRVMASGYYAVIGA